jgi:hypothetical protein
MPGSFSGIGIGSGLAYLIYQTCIALLLVATTFHFSRLSIGLGILAICIYTALWVVFGFCGSIYTAFECIFGGSVYVWDCYIFAV